MYLFTYGLLTHPSYMVGFTGKRAHIENAKFDIHHFANVTTGTDNVYGVLWEVNENKIELLDMTEGAPDFYKRITVPVVCNGSIVEAFMYAMTDDTVAKHLNESPTSQYLRILEFGYMHFNLERGQFLNLPSLYESTINQPH